MAFSHGREWRREVIDGYIYWLQDFDIRCYNCGCVEHASAVVREGEYDEDMEQEITDPDTGEKKIIYPTFAPQSTNIDGWDIPDGWTQITHVAKHFYPMEICTAIKNMGMDPQLAFDKWYNDVGTQFAEWVCPEEECFVEAARKIYRRDRKYMPKGESGLNGKPVQP